MADQYVDEMTAASAAEADDLLYLLRDGGLDRRITPPVLFGGGSPGRVPVYGTNGLLTPAIGAASITTAADGSVTLTAAHKYAYAEGEAHFKSAAGDFALSENASADNSGALNAAALYCRTNRKKLKLPAGIYRITSPIFLTDTPFQSIEVEGDSRGFDGTTSPAATNGRTVIWADFNDRPAIVISYGRGVRLAHIAIVGNNVAPAALTEPSFTQASYLSAGIRVDRYSPQCGICIDANVGSTPPGGGYPGMTYANPNSGSWDVTLERVTVCKFAVGIMLSPSGSSLQGDQIKIIHSRIDYCDIGIAWGQGQARVNSVVGTDIFNCRRALDGVTYGTQGGCPPKVVSLCQFGALAEVFRFANTVGSLSFHSCRGEAVQMWGTWGAGSAALRHPLKFDSCDLHAADPNFTETSAPWILESHSPTEFVSCSFVNDSNRLRGTFNLVGEGGSYTYRGCSFIDGFSSTHPLIGLRVNHSVGGGNSARFDSCLAAISGGISYLFGNTNRNIGLPVRIDAQHATSWIADGNQEYVYRHGHYDTFVDCGTGTAITFSATQVSFTVVDPLLFQTDDLLFWLMNGIGSAVQAYVPALVVASVVSTTVTCNLLFPRTRYDEAFTAIWNVRREWAPGTALTGNTASNTTLSSVSPTTILRNGDWIKGSGIPANTRVVSGGGTATVTISRNATATATGVPLYNGRLHQLTTTAAF